MATIYLSSTYEDLKDHRRVVYEALRKAGHQVIAMEDYVATDQRPVEKCLKNVEKADIYVGLFAFRYGYVPPLQHNNPNGLSITELEYRRAETSKRPCLTFVVHDTTAWPRVFDDAHTGDDRGEAIKALRQHLLTEKLASQFSSPYELSTLVLAAVTKHLVDCKSLESTKKQKTPETVSAWNIETQGAPYPGLLHFTRPYASVFFGREVEIDEILDRMRKPEGRFLLISGASGSGKSSLVDAGVLPRIEKSGIAGDKTYTCVRMVPSKGSHPFDALLRPLHVYAERVGMDVYQVAEELAREPGNLSARIGDIVSKGLETNGLVLFLDQMEELFTTRDLAQSQAFLSALYQAAQDARLSVIATIRSDFLQHCYEHVDLLRVLKGQGHYPLGPVDGISIGEMIAKPAHCAGLTIGEALVRRLVKKAGEERGSLPLLAFALRQLFDKRSGKELTETAFRQLGGLVGAIRSHVEAVEDKILKSLETDDQRVFAKLFAPLVSVTVDRTAIRKWASKEKFDADLRSMIDLLIKERLLNADEGQDHESLISVAHECLFEGWPRLAAWIETNREHLFILRQAEIEAGEWKKHGYDVNYLWSEERLKKLQGIIKGSGHEQVSEAVQVYASPQYPLIERLQDKGLIHNERLKIGQYLALLGDPRPGVGVKDGIPDIVWIEIPGGQVKIESVEDIDIFSVKGFRIAKYLVTNEQFEAFLKADDGYGNEKWWKGLNPSKPANSYQQEANCPREMVSSEEAIAFCRWFSAKTRTSIRLPTEWEWQQAATGGDPQRKYPWEGGWDTSRCNTKESGLRRTTAVGMYPLGATPQGVLDMVGNVRELCMNTCVFPSVSPSRLFGLRGDSWQSELGLANLRNALLGWGLRGVEDRANFIGLRLVQDLES